MKRLLPGGKVPRGVENTVRLENAHLGVAQGTGGRKHLASVPLTSLCKPKYMRSLKVLLCLEVEVMHRGVNWFCSTETTPLVWIYLKMISLFTNPKLNLIGFVLV